MKAILVVDVEEYGDYYVDVYRKDASDRFEGRYYLKPMPHDYPPYGKIINQNFYTEEESDAYEKGWNDCIEEITGETE